MAQKYFRNVPNFEYVNRTKDGQNISDYTEVKNIFKRAKLRQDIFQDLTYFTKYQVVGDARPDNVAFEVYGDANLDWLVMLCNNIMNLETEWPLTQESFDNYVMNKYGSYEQIDATRHYETIEIRDSNKLTIVPAGLEVPSDFSITFYDSGLGQMITESKVYPVSNFEYESKLQEQKRNIYLLKANYIGIVIDDIEEIMPYISGSSQYINDRLVRGENIRLYS